MWQGHTNPGPQGRGPIVIRVGSGSEVLVGPGVQTAASSSKQQAAADRRREEEEEEEEEVVRRRRRAA